MLQDLDMINNDEETMYDELQNHEIVTQDMITELTFKILQPRLEFTKLEEEELKEDKMELEDQCKELKTKIKTNTDRFDKKIK
tara:strand:+ start:348 stop:596 length:249 start_codon:yes stop_codon:yes gene_type:complete